MQEGVCNEVTCDERDTIIIFACDSVFVCGDGDLCGECYSYKTAGNFGKMEDHPSSRTSGVSILRSPILRRGSDLQETG
mgnify:CR=1 FL=1